MTADIWIAYAITLAAIGLFIWNRLRVDVVGLIVMAALIVTGLVTVREGTSGFANEAMLTVAAMFVLSAGLVRTGAVDALGRRLVRLAGKSEFRLLVVSLALVIPLSAFMNNTPVVLVMIPLVLGISREVHSAPSRTLMHVSFASQMGGTLTLIGTSTNLLVAGLVLELGLERIRLFDITLPAAALTVVGVAYLLTVGRWLTPTRTAAADLVDAYELRDYLSVLHVEAGSPLTDRTLGELRFASEYGLLVVGLEREGDKLVAIDANTRIHGDDFLLVEGKIKDIAAIKETAGVTISRPSGELALPEEHAAEAGRRPAAEFQLAELLVPPRSPVVGRTIRQLDFRHRFRLTVLGIQRHGVSLVDRVRDVVLAPGDLLLVE
ncbi:MAG: SLC13 family permease, partial [Gemmatimonadales bacterium]